MFVLLPLISLILLFLIFRKRIGCWRSAVLAAAIIFGVMVTVVTEVLSISKSLAFGWLVGLWAATSIALCWLYARSSKNRETLVPTARKRLPLLLASWIAGVSFIVMVIGLIALIAPPNNSDSMIYHLSRVVHWMQNHSVSHYPTHILTQLHHAPWSEFVVLHLQILSGGGDRFANLVQWFAMIGSIAGVTLIAKQFGAELRGQIFAAVVVATLPAGILQGSSTHNSYVAAFWLVCFASYALRAREPGGQNLLNWLAIGASLGLALLTKATAYIFAFPFLIWFSISSIRMLGLKAWRPLLVAAAITLSINAGYYARNLDLYGSPLGPGQETALGLRYTNDAFTPPILISNVLRNISLQLGTPAPGVNSAIESGVRRLHATLGLDINDPRATWPGTAFRAPSLSLHEDAAGNPLHLALVLLALGVCLLQRDLCERKMMIYIVAVACGFLLFCLTLKWQPWHSRLHLPLFVLSSPFVATALSKFSYRKLVVPAAIVLILCTLPWLFFNETRALIGHLSVFNMSRADKYFDNRADLREPYQETVEFLNARKCSRIGLSSDTEGFEYPLWALLRSSANAPVRIEHINVKNPSARMFATNDGKSFVPCAIVSLAFAESGNVITATGVYVEEKSFGPVVVFTKRALDAALPGSMSEGQGEINGSATPPDISAPSVSITRPVNGASFPVGATVTFEAEASAASGRLTKVEYFTGSNRLYEATAAPYTYTVTTNNLLPGTYPVTAVATDSQGRTSHSATISVTLTR